MNEIRIEYNKVVQSLILIPLIVLFGFGIYILSLCPSAGYLVILVIAEGLICALVGLFLFIITLNRLIKNTPIIVINDKGIMSSSFNLKNKSIPWEMIEDIQLINFFSIKYIGIDVNNFENFSTNLSQIDKLFAKSDKHFGYPPCLIYVGSSVTKSEKILEIIKNEWKKHCNTNSN